MPELIYETVVTTRSPDGVVHVAPMGVRHVGDEVVLMPFRPSVTLANIEATGHAVMNLLTDVRVFAGCVTGRREWPTVALDGERAGGATDVGNVGNAVEDGSARGGTSGSRPSGVDRASPFPGVRLAAALGHVALRLVASDDDGQRPVLRLARVHAAQHAFFQGHNRAQAAVVEGAVLVSRLHMLPADKIDGEMRYLQIAIDKTAGPAELEAWGWLCEAVAAHRAGAQAGGRDAAPPLTWVVPAS